METRKITAIIKAKPYLGWDLKSVDTLSDDAAFERILNFGDWNDVQNAIKILSISNAKTIFLRLAEKERTNLRPQTVNYFKLYFDKYAP
jgi:hypothetical protein